MKFRMKSGEEYIWYMFFFYYYSVQKLLSLGLLIFCYERWFLTVKKEHIKGVLKQIAQENVCTKEG